MASSGLVDWPDNQAHKVRKYVVDALKLYNPDGSLTGAAIWRFDICTRILAHRITLAGVSNAYARGLLIRQALGQVRAISLPAAEAVEPFREALAKLVDERRRRPRQRFRVIYPLNLRPQQAEPFHRIRVGGRTIRRLTWKQLEGEVELAEWWKKADRLVAPHSARLLTGSFVPLETPVDAATGEEAWPEVSPTFELIRAVLNLQGTWGMVTMQSGRPRPLGELLSSPIFPIFDASGKEVASYIISTRHEYSPFTPRDRNWARARQFLRRLDSIRGPEIRQLVIDALIRYGEALDTVEWRQAFLALWQVLELLTAQSVGELNMRDVRNRIALLLGQSEGERDLLEALADTRNTLVHAGRYPDNDGLEEAQFLKAVVEWSIEALLGLTRLLSSVASLKILYEHLGRPDTELRELHRVIAAIRRQRARRRH
jgi:hypothetical protein